MRADQYFLSKGAHETVPLVLPVAVDAEAVCAA